ncbi:MAG TPA: iron ABC transporter substrate-binding protein, partial [Paraburkholderia sp.]
KLMATDHVSFEYPLRAGVAADPILKPFDQLQPPALTLEQLGDDSQAGKLLREAGLL